MGDNGKDAGDHPAKLTMPDGQVLELPVLRDASGGRFLDIRKLHPRCEAMFTLDTACAVKW